MSLKKTFSAIAITLTTILSCAPMSAFASEITSVPDFSTCKVGDVIDYNGHKIEVVSLDEIPENITPKNIDDVSLDDVITTLEQTPVTVTDEEQVTQSSLMNPNKPKSARSGDKIIHDSACQKAATVVGGPVINIGIDYTYCYNYYGSYYNSVKNAYVLLTGYTAATTWDHGGYNANISSDKQRINVTVNGVLNTYLVTSAGGLGLKVSSLVKSYSTTFRF